MRQEKATAEEAAKYYPFYSFQRLERMVAHLSTILDTKYVLHIKNEYDSPRTALWITRHGSPKILWECVPEITWHSRVEKHTLRLPKTFCKDPICVPIQLRRHK
jgi:hypothetical protein